MRRPRTTVEALDSLLDTLFNVVGILVFLVAVTQLSVDDSLRGIRGEKPPPSDLDPATFEALRAEVAALEQQLDGLAGLWAALAAGRELDAGQLAATDAHAAPPLPPPEPPAAVDLDRILESIAARRRRIQELEGRLAGVLAERDRLLGQLAATPVPQPPTPQVVTLPDPRPAPADSVPIRFLCRYGRIVPAGDDLKEALYRGVAAAVGGDGTRVAQSQFARVAAHFDWNDVGSRALRWRIRLRGGTLLGSLEWRGAGVGEGVEQLQATGSDFRRALSAANPGSHHLRFEVWSDSFEVYGAARRLADEAGLASGWVAFDVAEEMEDFPLIGTAGGKPAPGEVD